MDETLDSLLTKLALFRGSLRGAEVSKQLTWANPDWAANIAAGDIQQSAMRLCLAYNNTVVSVIPSVAKQMKAAGYDLVTTRDSRQRVLSVVMYTSVGQFILNWDQPVLAAYIDVCRTAVLEEPGMPQPEYRKGILGALKHLVDALKGKA